MTAGQRDFATTTRDISKRGLFFFSELSPEENVSVSMRLHPHSDESFELVGRVRVPVPGIGAGIELVESGRGFARYQDFVDRVALSKMAWQTIGEQMREEASHDRSIPLRVKPTMVRIGDHLRALEIVFERHPPTSPESLNATLKIVPGSRGTLAEVSIAPVRVKLHADDELRKAYVGRLTDNSLVLAIIDERCQSYRIFAPTGSEQILVMGETVPVFPYYTTDDLGRIASDVSQDSRDFEAFPPSGLSQDILMASPLSDWTPYGPNVIPTIQRLLDSLDAEVRVYTIGSKERCVRLLRDCTMLIRDRATHTQRSGVLMNDGKRDCVLFGLKTKEPLEIKPLTAEDEIRFPAL